MRGAPGDPGQISQRRSVEQRCRDGRAHLRRTKPTPVTIAVVTRDPAPSHNSEAKAG